MKKFVENVKRYIQYRKNRMYVKMETMRIQTEIYKFLTEVIKEKNGIGIEGLSKNALDYFKMIGYQAEKAKQEGR